VDSYSSDRLFVYLRLEGSDNEALDEHVQALTTKGIPCAVLPLSERYEVAGQFFLWEFATAVAGAVLHINPFDQPNVESAKIQARAALKRYEETRALEIGSPVRTDGPLSFYGPELKARDSKEYLEQYIANAGEGCYYALMAYIDRQAEYEQQLQVLASTLTRREGKPATVGFGPRFLHSTGQLHKGGPNTGVFIQLVQDEADDLPIPGRSYSFGILKRSQALGDLAALQAADRRVVCINLGSDVSAGLIKLIALVNGD
jgi:transaldolase/glucose-6-phosphate isomerase